jgi:site-specific DNA-adenine methylase
MSDSQHTELVDICLKSKAKILLSGYECEEYKKLEDAGWNKELFEVKTVTSNNERKTKTEVFWWNYKLENNLF